MRGRSPERCCPIRRGTVPLDYSTGRVLAPVSRRLMRSGGVFLSASLPSLRTALRRPRAVSIQGRGVSPASALGGAERSGAAARAAGGSRALRGTVKRSYLFKCMLDILSSKEECISSMRHLLRNRIDAVLPLPSPDSGGSTRHRHPEQAGRARIGRCRPCARTARTRQPTERR